MRKLLGVLAVVGVLSITVAPEAQAYDWGPPVTEVQFLDTGIGVGSPVVEDYVTADSGGAMHFVAEKMLPRTKAMVTYSQTTVSAGSMISAAVVNSTVLDAIGGAPDLTIRVATYRNGVLCDAGDYTWSGVGYSTVGVGTTDCVYADAPSATWTATTQVWTRSPNLKFDVEAHVNMTYFPLVLGDGVEIVE